MASTETERAEKKLVEEDLKSGNGLETGNDSNLQASVEST